LEIVLDTAPGGVACACAGPWVPAGGLGTVVTLAYVGILPAPDDNGVSWSGTYLACDGTTTTAYAKLSIQGGLCLFDVWATNPGEAGRVSGYFYIQTTIVYELCHNLDWSAHVAWLIFATAGCDLWAYLQTPAVAGERIAAPPPAALARPNRCEYLGRRTEFRSGCAGIHCRHACELNLPAVPAGYCQTCKEYEPDPLTLPWV
jgi:hypothetical protein